MRNIPFFGLFFWFGRIAWAQEELNLPEVGPPSTFQGGVGVLRFVVAFLLIIVILWVFFCAPAKVRWSECSNFFFQIHACSRYFAGSGKSFFLSYPGRRKDCDGGAKWEYGTGSSRVAFG